MGAVETGKPCLLRRFPRGPRGPGDVVAAGAGAVSAELSYAYLTGITTHDRIGTRGAEAR
jgi:hypothetical protein